MKFIINGSGTMNFFDLVNKRESVRGYLDKEVEKENILYEDKVKYKASLVKEGKSKAYNEDEFLDLLKKERL